MSSGWGTEVAAVFRKEWLIEQRSRTGFLTALLSSVLTVAAIAFGAFTTDLSGRLAAGLLWVAMSFAATVAVPRTFLSEEESGTSDLLRVYARPHAVFWGKALFNTVQMTLTSLILAVLFVGLMNLKVPNPFLLTAGLIGGAAALSGTVTLCAALVAQGSNRSTLAGAISIPMLIPLILMGIGACRAAFGDGASDSGWLLCFGLWCYAIAVFAVAPNLFASIWRQD